MRGSRGADARARAAAGVGSRRPGGFRRGAAGPAGDSRSGADMREAAGLPGAETARRSLDAVHASTRRYLRALLAFLPLLGFVGTVIGLAVAIGSLGGDGGASGRGVSPTSALASQVCRSSSRRRFWGFSVGSSRPGARRHRAPRGRNARAVSPLGRGRAADGRCALRPSPTTTTMRPGAWAATFR